MIDFTRGIAVGIMHLVGLYYVFSFPFLSSYYVVVVVVNTAKSISRLRPGSDDSARNGVIFLPNRQLESSHIIVDSIYGLRAVVHHCYP